MCCSPCKGIEQHSRRRPLDAKHPAAPTPTTLTRYTSVHRQHLHQFPFSTPQHRAEPRQTGCNLQNRILSPTGIPHSNLHAYSYPPPCHPLGCPSVFTTGPEHSERAILPPWHLYLSRKKRQRIGAVNGCGHGRATLDHGVKPGQSVAVTRPAGPPANKKRTKMTIDARQVTLKCLWL